MNLISNLQAINFESYYKIIYWFLIVMLLVAVSVIETYLFEKSSISSVEKAVANESDRNQFETKSNRKWITHKNDSYDTSPLLNRNYFQSGIQENCYWKQHKKKGMKYFEQGKYKKAVKHLRHALYVHSQNIKTLIALGNTYRKMGKKRKARRWFTRVKEIETDHPVAEHLLETIQPSTKTSSNLQNKFNTAREKFEDNNYQSARQSFLKILPSDPTNLSILNWLGLTNYEMNETNKARNYFETVLILDRENEFAQEYIKKVLQR